MRISAQSLGEIVLWGQNAKGPKEIEDEMNEKEENEELSKTDKLES